MFQYNVLTEGWIPVETLDGKSKLVGILEVLIHAHEIRCVKAASPLVTYGIQRTLIALLIDAFRPSDIDALAEIISKGKFDETTLNGYIEECIVEGSSFNLFDENRPFLQNKFDGKLDTKISFINKLFLEIPEGNNHAHFVHRMESERFFTPAECLQALCSLTAFATNCGTNAYFSINGAPPIYFLYAGKNLFETLSASMIAESEHRGILLDNPPIVWRNFVEVKQGEQVAKTSLLYGLTCQPRRVKLIPMKQDGHILVKEMYYSIGWNFKGLPNWKDPHVVYIYDKKGNYSLKAREGRAIWRDLGNIMNTNSSPQILNKINEKFDMDVNIVLLNSFGIVGNFKGPVFAVNSWFEESLNLDTRILNCESKLSFVNSVQSKIEDINSVLCRILKKSIKQLQGQKGSDKEHSRYVNLVEQAKTLYFSTLRTYFLNSFCNNVSNIEASSYDWELDIKRDAGKNIKTSAEFAFNTVCNNIGTSAKTLVWRAIAENMFRQGIYKELKGGWLDEQRY